MDTKIKYIGILLLLLIVSACSRQSENISDSTKETDSLFVRLSENQVKVAEIQQGKISKKLLSEVINCTGSIEADPNQSAMVSPPLKGYLNRIYVHIGDYVRRGEALANLSHPDYIQMQQAYLETLSQYEYYKTDFARQGELTLENAASMKTMQQAEREFKGVEAKLYALKENLSFLGINPDSLKVENIQKSVTLRSPINGYITKIKGHIGMLCPAEVPMFHVVGSKDALLHLNVYERDANRLEIGQMLSFHVISQKDRQYSAKIRSIARALDESKTINVHAEIADGATGLMPGMFVRAQISIDSDSVFALPMDAVARTDKINYIFRVVNDTTFQPFEITTGTEKDGWMEIKDPTKDIMQTQLVVSGAYYLLAEMMSEEE